MLPGSGDELQGIKRGIMEMADAIFINKADNNLERAKRAKKDFQNALHLFPPALSNWTIPVELGSSLEKDGIDQMWKICEDYKKETTGSGWLQENRKEQEIKWFHQLLGQRLQSDFYTAPATREKIKKAEEMISSASISARKGVEDLFTS